MCVNNGVVCGAHLDSQYLFIERCDTSTLPHRAGERKKDEREKRTETSKRIIVNKWPAYLFGEKANSCTGQNADSMPESRCQSKKDSSPVSQILFFSFEPFSHFK